MIYKKNYGNIFLKLYPVDYPSFHFEPKLSFENVSKILFMSKPLKIYFSRQIKGHIIFLLHFWGKGIFKSLL